MNTQQLNITYGSFRRPQHAEGAFSSFSSRVQSLGRNFGSMMTKEKYKRALSEIKETRKRLRELELACREDMKGMK